MLRRRDQVLKKRKRDNQDDNNEEVIKRAKRGHSKNKWNAEKEMTRSLSSTLKKVQKCDRRHLMTSRNVRKFRSIANELGMVGSKKLFSVFSDPDINEEETMKMIEDCTEDRSHVKSIDSGDLGAVVTIPNTPTQVKSPFRIVIAGPSMSGKTELVFEMLRQRNFMFQPTPPIVYWFYSMEESITEAREEFTKITFIKDLPTDEWIKDTIDPKKGALFIIDDLMCDASGSGRAQK